MMKHWKTLFLLTTCCTLGLMTTVRAQVSPDGTLSTTVTSPDSSNFTINNGNRVGGNLFHSFREFSVPNGGSAVFQNALDVQNIISRVTGGSLSQINGLIQSQGSANLFLLNPAGIFFGQNARLNIGGSFFATTADSFLFDNGFEFSATNPQAPPLLTVNIPVGLRFRDNPGEIRVQGFGQTDGLAGIATRFNNPTLEVPVGDNLSLVGGNVNLDGGVLQATGGRVQLGGLTAAGTVGINANQTLSFPDGVARGDVSLTNRAAINVIANQLGGRSININARNIGISGESLVTAGIPENLGTVDNSAGNITLNATGETRIDQSRIENNVNIGTIANSSNIDITTGSFVLTNRAELNASNLVETESELSSAGDVRVTANGLITVDGAARIRSDGFFGRVFLTSNNDSINISDGSSVGTSSSNDITNLTQFSVIRINAPQGSVSLNNDSLINITNEGTGFAGDITLNARDQISIAESRILAQGNQGRILIGDQLSPASVRIVSTNTNNRLTTSTSNGRAGDISIQATGLVEFDGNNLFSNVLSGAQNAQAGNITIKAGSLSLLNGAGLQSRVLEGGQGNSGNVRVDVPDGIVRIAGRNSGGNRSGIFNDVESGASGDAGNITINAGSIFTDDGELRTTNAGTGIAGDITLNARDQISITESRISARGNQGGIFIGEQLSPASVRIVSTNTNNSLTTSTSNGRAGDISIQATGSIEFDGNFLFSNVLSGAQNGQAGNINIKAGSLSLLNGAQLQSRVLEGGQGNSGNVRVDVPDGIVRIAGRNSGGNRSGIFNDVESGASGDAGNITINAGSIFTDDGELRTTNAGTGIAGDITLNARDQISITESRISARGNQGGIFIGEQLSPASVRIVSTNTNNSLTTSTSNGRAGDISIQATGSIEFDGNNLFSNVLSGAQNGQAGNITIKAGSLSLLNGAQVQSNVDEGGQGNAGNVTLRAENGDISLAGGSVIFSTVESGGMSNAGKIDIITRDLSLTGGSQLQTLVRAGEQSNAGNISVQASGTVNIAGRDSDGNRSSIFSTVESGASGNAGNITINAGSIFTDDAFLRARNEGNGSAGNISLQVGEAIALKNGSQISSSIFGTGNAGNVTLRAENGDISLAGGSVIFSTVESGGTGNAGKIDVTSRNLSLTEGSQLQTLVRGRGNAGNVTLRTQNGDISLAGSDIFSTVESGGTGNAGGIDITTKTLSLENGASLNVITSGMGDAGIVKIQASDISLNGVGSDRFSSGIFSTVQGNAVGNAGGIDITTGRLSLTNGAIINASTFATGDAGTVKIQASDTIFASGVGSNTVTSGIRSSVQDNAIGNGGGIDISTKNLSFTNGAQIIANTSSNGNAGNVTVNASDRVSFAGVNSGIFANTTLNSTGNGGNITIQPLQNGFPRIAISDGAEVTVDSQGQGRGGNLSITGNTLSLDRGTISASTTSADGGNIDLRLRNFLRLQNESLISANAGGGNGGNITINTPFIVAFPRNNDITANAGSGSGGQVTINAIGRFGINPLSAADLQRLRPNDLDPRQLPTSDITAISRDNPSLSGNVQVNSPDVDPSRGLVELPETVSDPTQQIAQNPCQQDFGNEFTITGRGGLPTTPNQTLSSDNVRVDLLQPVASSRNSRSATITKPATTAKARRLPAQGWIFNDKGQVVLTAYDPTNTGSQRSWRTAAACPAR